MIDRQEIDRPRILECTVLIRHYQHRLRGKSRYAGGQAGFAARTYVQHLRAANVLQTFQAAHLHRSAFDRARGNDPLQLLGDRIPALQGDRERLIVRRASGPLHIVDEAVQECSLDRLGGKFRLRVSWARHARGE
jgi:hypothetical protein